MTNTIQPFIQPTANPAGRSFNELPLSPDLLATLQQLEYLTMTPIQVASLPIALAGHDLMTGSGKTGAREPWTGKPVRVGWVEQVVPINRHRKARGIGTAPQFIHVLTSLNKGQKGK